MCDYLSSFIGKRLKKGTCVCKKERWTPATQASDKVVTRAFAVRILIRLMSKLNAFFRPVFFQLLLLFFNFCTRTGSSLNYGVSFFCDIHHSFLQLWFLSPGPLSTCSVFHLRFQVSFLKGSLYYHRPYTFGGGWSQDIEGPKISKLCTTTTTTIWFCQK